MSGITDKRKGKFDDAKKDKNINTNTTEKIEGDTFTAVSMRMTLTDRNKFKKYCIDHNLKLTDAFSMAVNEFMENHP